MISPQFQNVIYKEREIQLMLKIERRLAAQERGYLERSTLARYSLTLQRLKEKIFSRPAPKPQPMTADCPCVEEPC